MSYTRPAFDAAGASWAAATAYTRPAYDAAGAVIADAAIATYPAVGFIPTVFGAPRATMTGTAVAMAPVTNFGAASASMYSSTAGLGLVTAFGAPSSPSAQSAQATGFITTKTLGRPVALVFSQPITNLFLQAYSFQPTAFGDATMLTQVGVQATGNIATALGTPGSRRSQAAQALEPASAFGTPVSMSGIYATGFSAAVLGTPTVACAQPASSTYRATRWGTPNVERSDTYKARGLFSPARFAKPTALQINAHQASGDASVQFGAPACYQRYRALHCAPSCRFGKPLVIWGISC